MEIPVEHYTYIYIVGTLEGATFDTGTYDTLDKARDVARSRSVDDSAWGVWVKDQDDPNDAGELVCVAFGMHIFEGPY